MKFASLAFALFALQAAGQEEDMMIMDEAMPVDPMTMDEGEDLERFVENWAEDILDANSDLIESITNSTQAIILDIAENLTAELNETVSDAFDQIQNGTASALDQARDQIMDGIEEAQIELGIESDDSDDEMEMTEAVNLLKDAEEGSSTQTFVIAALAGATTAATLIATHKKCSKNDEDFMRA